MYRASNTLKPFEIYMLVVVVDLMPQFTGIAVDTPGNFS